ncbi:translation initiation factor IF-3 [Magnetovibrio blakemorei]|uniref:Translation initiation factor IF-3 n=1 Tax=Magnetovibrio blakemorei TaxID=28181 RepID=A0A1E5Q8T7_9PROT|nr:translation initiation factor IF-3 [Magnetovibrio blakemorei]
MARPPFNKKPTFDGPNINERITAQEVRLVGPEGEMIGVKTTQEAIQIAVGHGLDLVEVSPNAEPPVCKILDYGKYKYEEQKKRNEAKKKQKVIAIKEIKMRPGIDIHDYEVKMKAARKFLDNGDKVKVTIRFRGREMAHQDLGLKVLVKMRDELEELTKVEQMPKSEGRMMTMVLAPK